MNTAFSSARSPKDDDLTPPELRGGNGSAHFVQPGAGGSSSTGSSSPEDGGSRRARRSSKQEVSQKKRFRSCGSDGTGIFCCSLSLARSFFFCLALNRSYIVTVLDCLPYFLSFFSDCKKQLSLIRAYCIPPTNQKQCVIGVKMMLNSFVLTVPFCCSISLLENLSFTRLPVT